MPVRQTAMFLSGMSSAPTLQPRWSTQPCSSCAKSSVVSPPAVALRGTEQQLEVAVARHQAALQVADAVLRRELALQALEGRAQQALHQREGTGLAALARFARDDADGAEQRRVGITQHEDVRRVLAVDRLGEAIAAGVLAEFL